MTSKLLVSQAASIGRCDRSVRDYLERNYTPEVVATDEGAVKLVVKALMEVQSGSGGRNLDIAVLKNKKPIMMLTNYEINAIIKEIEKEREQH